MALQECPRSRFRKHSKRIKGALEDPRSIVFCEGACKERLGIPIAFTFMATGKCPRSYGTLIRVVEWSLIFQVRSIKNQALEHNRKDTAIQ